MRHELSSHGIILRKHFPERLKISLLDESYGHIGVVPASWQWASYASIGAFISYDLYSECDVFFVKNIDLISVPVFKNEAGILFLHHVLEMCYFCLPVHGGQQDCFDFLLYCILMLEEITRTSIIQRLLLSKFLFLIGQYPHDIDKLAISRLLMEPCERLVTVTLDRDQQKELELFIYQCVQSHPYRRLLRTVNFLSQVGR